MRAEKLRDKLQNARDRYESAKQTLETSSKDIGMRLMRLALEYQPGKGLENAAYILGRMREAALEVQTAVAVVGDWERGRDELEALDRAERMASSGTG